MQPLREAFEMGVKYHQAGDLRQAEQLYHQVLQEDPHHAGALHLLGVAALQLDRYDLAANYIRSALGYQPRFAEAHYNLGIALQKQGKLDEAAASYQQSVRLKPDYVEAHYNLGLTLQEAGRLDEAMASWREALRLKPDYAEALNNLGFALKEQGRAEEAVVCLQEALRINPDCAEAHNNLGLAFIMQGKFKEAEAPFQEALRIQPDYYSAHWNRALLWLLQGDFKRGWDEHEWRWRDPKTPPRPFVQALWQGEALSGRTILLHAEQGLGDTLQFVRYVPQVKARGGIVLVEVQPALVRLLSRCPEIDRVIAQGEPLPPFDVHAPLFSLPRILETTSLERIPAAVPYLEADPGLVEFWRQRLESLPGMRVGIAWQGSPTYRGDRWRSVPLRHFAALAEVRGVSLISLQKGPGSEQLAQMPGLAVELADLDVTSGAFMDTAAVMKNLDLVITSDTAIPHLAGSLAAPTWMAVPYAPDWRWLLEREDSPWYPTMRLFRQRRPQDWDDVFTRIKAALEERVRERR
jgi:tetratricopeptide (TPR) repeat protein